MGLGNGIMVEGWFLAVLEAKERFCFVIIVLSIFFVFFLAKWFWGGIMAASGGKILIRRQRK